MSRVYVGNLQPNIQERDLENVFQVFGVLRSVWVGRRPDGPGYAYVEFDDRRDASDAIETLDGRNGWHVEFTHNSRGGKGSRASSEDISCSRCGGHGHFCTDCHFYELDESGCRRRSRSRSPQYHQSLSYRSRSNSPSGRPPNHHLTSFPYGIDDSTHRHSYCRRSYSQSPKPHGKYSLHSNGWRNQN